MNIIIEVPTWLSSSQVETLRRLFDILVSIMVTTIHETRLEKK